MRSGHVFSISTFLFTFCSAYAGAQSATSETSTPAVLQVWFRDSERGTAVRPDAILLDGKPIFPKVDETGSAVISTTEGDHELGIRGAGYDPMDTKQTAFSYDPPMNAIFLDPAQKTAELRPENLSRYMPGNSSLVAGFVVDEELSRPVEDAEVEIIDTELKAKTDSRGFFAVGVPMSQGATLPEDAAGRKFIKKGFRVTKEGYGYEERLNVAFETGVPKIFQIRLVPGGGGNTLDEETDRGGLQSWVFGIKDSETSGQPGTHTRPGDGLTTSQP